MIVTTQSGWMMSEQTAKSPIRGTWLAETDHGKRFLATGLPDVYEIFVEWRAKH
jgi:hypothetical protein